MAFEFNKVLVTGAAGFIGFHLARRLLADGVSVAGLDNLNAYYDVKLKKDRLKLLTAEKNFTFFQTDLADRDGLAAVFDGRGFESSMGGPENTNGASIDPSVRVDPCPEHHRSLDPRQHQ